MMRLYTVIRTKFHFPIQKVILYKVKLFLSNFILYEILFSGKIISSGDIDELKEDYTGPRRREVILTG